MIIRELYIKNFGKFSEQHFYFHDGVQVISGENEFGKSTIHAFIRAMLFGLERGRGRAAAKDDFTRYEPWDNPGYYAGVMRFSCGGRNFRLERSFARMNRQVSLVCEDDGEELSVEHGDLDMLLGGMTAELYDSTVSIGQLKARPGEELPEALENYAADYLETGGTQMDLNRAVQILRERRKAAAKALRIEQEREEEEKKALEQERMYLERDMEDLRKEYEDLSEQEKAAHEQANRRQTDCEKSGGLEHAQGGAEPEKASVKSLLAAGGAGLLISVMGLAWSQAVAGLSKGSNSLPFAVIAGGIGIAGVALLVCGAVSLVKARSRQREQIRKAEKSAVENKDGEQVDFEEKMRRLSWEMGRIQAQFKEKEIRRGNLLEQAGEFRPGEKRMALERRCRALELAAQELLRAGEETSGQMTDLVNQKASEIFSDITCGKYRGMTWDRENGFRVWDGTRRIPADRLSRGTLEQIWFSFRMAGAQVLQEEPMPVILDETFAFYDEKRLQSALKWLRGQKKQVIIFTCHDREELV